MLVNAGRRRPIWIWVALVISGLVTSFLVIFLLSSKSAAPELNLGQNTPLKSNPAISLSSRVLFLGNVYWGRYINDWSMKSELKYAYPFSRLSEFKREDYNAWISTLECPSVYGVNITSAQEDATLTFNCSPDYLPEAAKWFDIFSLSNNHTDNQGLEGFEETKQNLSKNGIQYFGSHNPSIVEDACEVLTIKANIKYEDGKIETGQIPIAICGYQGVFSIPPDESINQISKYSEFLPTFVMPHMGAEYVPRPDELKANVYHAMVDAGADLVIGDHPHTIQTSEVYSGVPIIYSMGNFIFDQQGFLEMTRSAGLDVEMTVSEENNSAIDKWLEIGPKCTEFKDSCLELIKSQNLNKLSFDYKLGIVGSNDDKKIVKPASEAELTSILERLNWSKTVQNLQPPYSAR